MQKDFDDWNQIKKTLEQRNDFPDFREKEVWWCNVGINIGYEADGKGKHKTRPILILRKFNKHMFYGVPLTTKIKKNPYYHEIFFQEKQQCVMVSQMRLWESKRLTTRLGQVTKKQFNEIRHSIRKLI